MTKQLITKQFAQLEQYGKLKDLRKEIDNILSRCEDDDPTYEVSLEYLWNDPYVNFKVEYQRLETDEEYEVRLRKENNYAQLQLERERQEYEKLKAKFEKGE